MRHWPLRKRSAVSTVMCRRCLRKSFVSNAMPVSTSVRWIASHSLPTMKNGVASDPHGPRHEYRASALCFYGSANWAGYGERRRRLSTLWTLCRAMPNKRWDMQRSVVHVPQLGSLHHEWKNASKVQRFCNSLRQCKRLGFSQCKRYVAKALFRMGIPVATRNIFPSTFRVCQPGSRCESVSRVTSGDARVWTSWWL